MTEGEAFPRRIPTLVIYLEPFRIVESATVAPWDVSIEQINTRGWDYAALHEIVGSIEVGLESPYHLVVTKDGALALPPIPSLRSEREAVSFFNRCLSALLIGGVYCQSVSLDHLELGSIIDWKYVRTNRSGRTESNRFHALCRLGMAPPIEAISLLNPRTIGLEELSSAMKIGLSVLETVSQLNGEFLVRGVTALARRDFGAALANLWITIEQITEYLWQRDVVELERASKERLKGRHDQLNDHRIWTVGNKHELLHQIGIIALPLLTSLSFARRARNKLSHAGKHPLEADSYATYKAVCGLLCAALGKVVPMEELPIEDHGLSDPFKPRENDPLNPQFWMEIPKLPGEHELELEEAAERSKEQKSNSGSTTNEDQ